MNKYKNENLRKFIESIPQEEIERQTRLQDEENRRDYQEFVGALKNENKCFLCGFQMGKFDETKPCFHWFTYPNGIKKKHFKNYLKNPLSFFRLDNYFRWLANRSQSAILTQDSRGVVSKICGQNTDSVVLPISAWFRLYISAQKLFSDTIFNTAIV